jgi:hypothetical protein
VMTLDVWLSLGAVVAVVLVCVWAARDDEA